MPAATSEFDIIARYFAPIGDKIGDDCALIPVRPGCELAVSADTFIEGVHFPAAAPPAQIAYRAAAAALSDLAATGARPAAITLALTLPAAEPDWLSGFAQGLRDALQTYRIELIGGDTARGPLAITVQALGDIETGQALTRAGARPGDALFVSGTPGDAAAALSVIRGEWPGDPRCHDYLLTRFYRPDSRIDLGRRLRGIATAAIDISDGLLADAAHLSQQSAVAIRIHADKLPLSPALQSVPDASQARDWALSGGDDYELLFTAPKDEKIEGCTLIGEVTPGQGVQCDHPTITPGYTHAWASEMQD